MADDYKPFESKRMSKKGQDMASQDLTMKVVTDKVFEALMRTEEDIKTSIKE